MRKLVLVLALTFPAVAVADDRPAPDAAFAEIERVVQRMQRSPAAERPKVLEELQRRCGEFLDQHGAKGSGDQVLKAAGAWFFAAEELKTPADAQRQRLAQVRTLPATPMLEQYLRTVDAKLNLRPGVAAPAWSALDIRDGSRVTLESYRGKVVLLDFWISWCPACKALAKDRLQPLQEKWGKDPRFALVGVGMPWEGDTAEKQKEFADAGGYGWRKVFDPTGDIAGSYAVRAPSLVLVDEAGKVLVLGPLSTMDEVERVLTERLGTPQR